MHKGSPNAESGSGPSPEISDLLAGRDLVLSSPQAPEEVSARLAQAGRRGRLPGFDATGGGRFRLDCDAIPFEHELRVSVVTASPGGSRLSLLLARKPMLPAVFALTLVLTVWPGVWLTDSLMATYWSAYGQWSNAMPWLTYVWYLPITVVPLPWMWRSLSRKSRATAAESAAKLVATIREIAAKAGG